MPDSTLKLDMTFFGRHCRFSATVLQALIEAGHRVNAVIVPGQAAGSRIVLEPALRPRIALSAPATLPTVAGLAWQAGAKLVEIGRDDVASLPDRFRELRKGVAISACFPWKLPVAVLETPKLGGLNVHPSLLPAHRGPDPVFWTLRAGDTHTGATIHRMTADFDAGAVVAQQAFALPIRSRAADIETRAVGLGTQLLVDLLAEFSDETLPIAIGLGGAETAIEPQPSAADLRLDTSWDAERAFRFVYGAGPGYGPLTLLLPSGDVLEVSDAAELQSGRVLAAELVQTNNGVLVGFEGGVVELVVVGV